MTYGYMRNASAMYQDTSVRGKVDGADRHQLTGLLYDAAIDRVQQARAAIRRGDVSAKGAHFARAQAILVELRATLDHNTPGDLSKRLDALYDYIGRRLLQAQLSNDEAAMDESIRLITPLRDAWQKIRPKFLADKQGAAA